jgi:NtrC-family two-component system sensor histidine kinase KinB
MLFSHLVIVGLKVSTLSDHIRMIDNVLDLSKLERGMLTVSRTRTDLVNLVKQIVHLNREQAERKAVCVTMHSDRPALAIDVDPGKITQLIDILVCNALKFSHPGGKIEIQICANETLASVSIRDEGQDISPERIEMLVGPSLCGDVIRREMADAALGLAVSKQIVALHDGTMNVQKQEGG